MAIHTDFRIAKAAKILPILEIARSLGIPERYVEQYGPHKAKIRLDVFEALPEKPHAKYVVVTAITPTPLGEGKTVNTIGLAMGLHRLGKKAVCCLRQPSMGPVFGIKGGATGGGLSQVVPIEDINLNLTGDIHAVGAAHNLLATFLDNHLHHGNALKVVPKTISWGRVVDLNDRALRQIRVAIGEKGERDSYFEITVASEVMAILALATSYRDMRNRLGRIIVGQTESGHPVTAEALKVAGAMALLCRDALKPNLLQTIENTPAFIHAGPFGNIAHGNSSVLADWIATRTADYVVTEAGFGADLGFEKLVDIKCPVSGLKPDAAVIICTVRALKVHAGTCRVVPGKPLPSELLKEDPDAVRSGAVNLARMIGIVKRTGVPAVVAVNRFPQDTEREIESIVTASRAAGADGVEVTEAFARGSSGAVVLARVVEKACHRPSTFKPFYDATWPIKKKIETIAWDVYGAGGVDYSERAEEQIATYTRWGLDPLPVCMAKTHLSLSHNQHLKGAPEGFRIPIKEIRASAGAGFLYPLVGDIMTMPGLGSVPGGEHMDIDDQGNLVGFAE